MWARSSSRPDWAGSPGSRPEADRPGGASPTGPLPSHPSPSRPPPERTDGDPHDVRRARVPGRFGGRGLGLVPLAPTLFLVPHRIPAQGRPGLPDLAARRLRLHAHPQAPRLAALSRRAPRSGYGLGRHPRTSAGAAGGHRARTGLGIMRPTVMGWRVRGRLHDGQIPDDYVKVAERLAHAWRVNAVRVVDSAPGSVTLLATMRDPLTAVDGTPETGELLTVRPGRLENGRDWVIDFRTVPHWLNAGATQSGKSNLANAIIKGLAPHPLAIVGLDLKGGVEFTPYKPRFFFLVLFFCV